MKTPSSFRLLSVTAALVLLATISSASDPSLTSTSVKLSAPGNPATLKIDLLSANLLVIGSDGDTVRVESLVPPSNPNTAPSATLRRLDEETPFDLTEHDNIVTLTTPKDSATSESGNPSSTLNLKVTLPRAMSLKCQVNYTTDGITARDLAGDVEILTMRGDIHLENISGTLVANTRIIGSIDARLSTPPSNLISISAMRGSIDLLLPPETNANIRLHARSSQGAIFTDFDAAKLKTTSKKGRLTSEARSQTIPGPYGPSSDGDLIINLRADGVFTLGTSITPATLDEVTQAAAAAFARNKNSGATVISQGRADARLIQKIWDACQKAGLTKISATSEEDFLAPKIDQQNLLPGAKLVSGTLNRGGVAVTLSTGYDGTIRLRQNRSAQTDPKETKDNITVTFLDPDKFTDVEEDFPGSPSTAYLGILRDYVQQTAAPLLPAGSKLTVTFLDIDLAGMIRPDRNDVRFMTGTTIPRMQLRFQLTGADGQVLQEGERKLSDMNYQMNIGLVGRNEPLYYDKALLKEWIVQEFKPRS